VNRPGWKRGAALAVACALFVSSGIAAAATSDSLEEIVVTAE
jgi:hypothetical protein